MGRVFLTREPGQPWRMGVVEDKTIVLDFAFDTPGIADGIPIYVPTPGDVLMAWYILPIEEWDGTTPKASLYPADGDPILGNLANQTSLDVDPATHYVGSGDDMVSSLGTDAATGWIFGSSEPLMLAVTDGVGGPAGSTQGRSRIALAITGD